jgi:hypothetical protein
MGKKQKNKSRKRDTWVNQEIEDEKTALEAIFGPDFAIEGSDPSDNKCSIHVVPHEAGLEANFVFATLHLTYVSLIYSFRGIPIPPKPMPMVYGALCFTMLCWNLVSLK